MLLRLICPNCERLLERVQQLTAENSKLREENAELRRRLALYENPNTPSSRRMYPSHSRTNCGKRFPGRPKGYPGKTRPKPKPDIVKAPEWKDRCERCGSPLGEPSYVNHHIVEEISNPSPRQVIDFLEFEWGCKACKAHTFSRHPDCPPDGRFGKNVLVQTTLMKFEERLPLQKIAEGLERQYELPITPATVLDITRRVSEWLRPECEAIRERIRRSRVVYIDETGEKVDGKRHWLWCFTTHTETLTVIRKSRGRKILEETLGDDFKGVIVCDGWRSYPTFTSRIQRDWAHLLREADWLAEHFEEAKPMKKALHRLYEDLKAWLLDDPPPKVRTRLKREARRRLSYWLDKRYKSVEAMRFVQKVRNGLDHWFTFVTTPGVEPTNNRAERALKEHVVQRKIIGTFRNGKGTRIYETIMTLLATWKQRGLNPYKAMSESLTAAWTKS
jgi:transposase